MPQLSRVPGVLHHPARGRRATTVLLASFALAAAACQTSAPAHHDPPSALDPHGTGAQIVLGELTIQLVLGAVIFVGVIGLLAAVVWRQSRQTDAVVEESDGPGMRWVWAGGIALPLVVLTGLFVLSTTNLVTLGAPPTPPSVTVEVTGHRWWWEVRYPNEGITTANEIHVPVGEPVMLRLESNDVIHSLWVPQIHGKLDMVPGETNETWLQVESPGIYRGICAEFCGLQHAAMHFQLVAMERERYDAWVEANMDPPPAPADELAQRGQELFMERGCARCHAIAGTAAGGDVGPNLSNFGSRLTIAGGTYRNNIGNLGGWIADPQHLKPGALMPPTDLTGEELQALLAYLRGLGDGAAGTSQP